MLQFCSSNKLEATKVTYQEAKTLDPREQGEVYQTLIDKYRPIVLKKQEQKKKEKAKTCQTHKVEDVMTDSDSNLQDKRGDDC